MDAIRSRSVSRARTFLAMLACAAGCLSMVTGCGSQRVTAPRSSLIVSLRFPNASGSSVSAPLRLTGLASTSIDSVRIRVFEVVLVASPRSVTIGRVLADRSVTLGPESTSFEVVLGVPEALQYGILAEAIGQRNRDSFGDTEYGLQFMGFAHRTPDELKDPVDVTMLDVVPVPSVGFDGKDELFTWTDPPPEVTDVRPQLSWTVQADGEILGDVTQTSFRSATHHQQYRVRLNLYEGLVSAFSEPVGIAFSSSRGARAAR